MFGAILRFRCLLRKRAVLLERFRHIFSIALAKARSEPFIGRS